MAVLAAKVQCLEENRVTETDGQLKEVWVDMVATAVTEVTVGKGASGEGERWDASVIRIYREQRGCLNMPEPIRFAR